MHFANIAHELVNQATVEIVWIKQSRRLLLKLNLALIDAQLPALFVGLQFNLLISAPNKNLSLYRFDDPRWMVINTKEDHPILAAIGPLQPDPLLLILAAWRKIGTSIFNAVDVLCVQGLAPERFAVVRHSEDDQPTVEGRIRPHCEGFSKRLSVLFDAFSLKPAIFFQLLKERVGIGVDVIRRQQAK